MAFLARYIEVNADVEVLTASIARVVGPLHDTDNALDGYHGMDHYWSFSSGRLMGQVMVQQGAEHLGVVVFTMPTMLQKAKARELLDQVVSAIPGAQVRPFPGGKGGLLTFV